jgi:hypothetical protein
MSSIREEIISGGFFWIGTPVAPAQRSGSKGYEKSLIGSFALVIVSS